MFFRFLRFSSISDPWHSKQFPHLFSATIEQASIGTFPVVVAPQEALLADVLNILEERRISSIPVIDQITERVTGLYYKVSDLQGKLNK
jgi:CBS domain-containing protein